MSIVHQGDLADRPWGGLLWRLASKGFSGEIAINVAGKDVRLALHQGLLVGGESPYATDGALRLAAQSQVVSAAQVAALAGTAAFFLTLAERAERAELPRPMSCVVLDETNRMTLHRMFVVGAARYTVSAVSRGMNLAPGALDPALSPLERALTRRELA